MGHHAKHLHRSSARSCGTCLLQEVCYTQDAKCKFSSASVPDCTHNVQKGKLGMTPAFYWQTSSSINTWPEGLQAHSCKNHPWLCLEWGLHLRACNLYRKKMKARREKTGDLPKVTQQLSARTTNWFRIFLNLAQCPVPIQDMLPLWIFKRQYSQADREKQIKYNCQGLLKASWGFPLV